MRVASSVAAVSVVDLRACVQSEIGYGFTPMEVGTCTLGVCTSGVAGEIEGGALIRQAGNRGTSWTLVQGVILMLGRSLGTLGSESAVGTRMDSVQGYGSAGEQLRHCLKIWSTSLMACSWVSQMVDGDPLMAHVNRLRACVTLSSFVRDGCAR